MRGFPFSAMFPTSDKTHTLPAHGNFVEKGKPPTRLHRFSCEEGEASRNGTGLFFAWLECGFLFSKFEVINFE